MDLIKKIFSIIFFLVIFLLLMLCLLAFIGGGFNDNFFIGIMLTLFLIFSLILFGKKIIKKDRKKLQTQATVSNTELKTKNIKGNYLISLLVISVLVIIIFLIFINEPKQEVVKTSTVSKLPDIENIKPNINNKMQKTNLPLENLNEIPYEKTHIKLLNKAKFLEKNAHYNLISDILNNAYQEAISPEDKYNVLLYWYDYNVRLFKMLPQPKKKLVIWQENEKNKMSVKEKLSFLYRHVTIIFLSEDKRKKQIDYEEKHPVIVVSKIEADKVLNYYDLIKTSLYNLLNNSENMIIDVDLDQKTQSQLSSLIKKIKNFKKNIISNRCDYVSYNIVGPYLSRTKQLLFISEISKPLSISHSSEILKKAIVIMAKGAEKKLLLSCHEDVGMYFIEVFVQLKGMAGKAELESLKVIQTLVEKINSKKIGPNNWW